MNNLYILTKQEFTSLYRFGQIPLNLNKVIETVTNSKEEAETKVFEVFMSLPYFVGDEEYLIISFENKLINEIWLEIENVSEIIPLTKAAKNSYQMKFDSKLNFAEARFENVVRKVEEETDIKEMQRGAKAFWNLCNVKNQYIDLLQDEIIKSAYYKRINGIKSADFTEYFFIHLLAYDRYEFFPNSDLGFFYDVGEIFAHSKGAHTFKGSGFYNYLENNKESFAQKSFLEISEIISNSQDVVKFTEQLTETDLKKYIVAAIFLKIKADLSERDTIKRSDTARLIRDFGKNENYIKELNFAIYLTGTFFGYKKFYDDLYELAGLKIFKKKLKPKQPDIKKKGKIEVDKTIKDRKTIINPNVGAEIVVEKETYTNITDSKDEPVTSQKITDEKSQEPVELIVESNKTNKEDFNEKQERKIEATKNNIQITENKSKPNIQSLIFEYVSKNGHCKIKPDIIDFVKERTGKAFNVGNIKSVIKNELFYKLELKKKERSEGVKLKDNELFANP